MMPSITKNRDFRGLQERRRKHVVSCKENDDYSHRMLAEEIYSKQTRFVYELLQNADDAGAKKTSFQLTESQLLFRHNGRSFAFNDLESITTFGQSTKLSEEGQIGKFGVGFKSVHSVTETPYIHSGSFHFKIKDYIVPYEVPSDEMPSMEESETLIILPFNHSPSARKKSRALTLRQLEELNTDCLLFLQNIEEISWEVEGGKQEHYRRIPKGDYTILERDGDANIRRYLVCKKDIFADDHSYTVNVAYLVDIDTNGNEAIAPAEENVFVFFPTTTSSKLKFLVQAPYKTTLNRESIDFEDEENYQLTKGLADLAGETLMELKQRDLLTSDFFLNILPTRPVNTESKEPCGVIARKLAEALKKKPLLPASGDIKHVKVENALLPLNEGLMNCLGAKDISNIFGRSCWLSPELKGIHTFLTSIDVKDVSFDSFLDILQKHKKFIERKPDEWLVILYSELTKCIDEGSGKLKEKIGMTPIVRQSNGYMIAPWGEDNRPQVYLPYSDGRESGYPTVSQHLARSNEAMELFKVLNLREPDDLAEIKEKIILKYKKGELDIEFSQYRKDIEYICQAFINSNHARQSEIKEILENINIVRTRFGVYVASASEDVYIPTDDIKVWFEGNHNVHIVDKNILNETKPKKGVSSLFEGVSSLFERLGCKKIDGIAKNFNEYRVREYSNHKIGEEGFNPAFNITGLEHAVKNISLQRSKILWAQLLKHHKHVKGRVRVSSNKNHLHKAPPMEMNSKAGEYLAGKRWLYDKQKNLINLDEYNSKSVDDLHDNYEKNDRTRADSLAKSLGLSPAFLTREESDKRVQEETRKWRERHKEAQKKISFWKKEYQDLEEKIRELESEKLNNKNWMKCPPGDGTPVEVEIEETLSPNGKNGGDKKIPAETPSKEVGRWGEEDVYLFLKNQEDNVEWLNERSEARKPYDIA